MDDVFGGTTDDDLLESTPTAPALQFLKPPQRKPKPPPSARPATRGDLRAAEEEFCTMERHGCVVLPQGFGKSAPLPIKIDR